MQVMAYDKEYRAEDDDAWYGVSVNLSENGRTLEVMFQDNDAWNVRYTSRKFKSISQVDELLKRFRSLSRQVQDNECDKVIEGMRVCAALNYQSGLRFYDATVEGVERKKHSITNGQEKCLCSFILCWLHGPRSGDNTIGNIADICIIQAVPLDNPRITSFAKLTKERILARCPKKRTAENSSSKRRLQDNEFKGYFGDRREGKETFRGSDEEVGGSNSRNCDGCYFILIENLEKDLTTSTIKQFIFEHTCVLPRAYLFPSRPSVRTGKGVIASDSKQNIEKIKEFVVHPKHFIVSASRRPWVVQEEILDEKWGATTGSLLSQSEDKFLLPRMQELKVVHFGTKAYNEAKKLMDLFADLREHEKQLYKILCLKETEILKSTHQGERPVHIR